jgi:hypothetical protein
MPTTPRPIAPTTSSSSADLVATGIPPEHVAIVWPALWPLLQAAYDRWSDDRADLLGGLAKLDYQLWAVFDGARPVAAIVTRLWTHTDTGARDCRLWLVGGRRMPEWLPDFISKLVPWARSEGCTRLTAAGRRGWWPFVASYGGYRIADESGLPAWALDIDRQLM